MSLQEIAPSTANGRRKGHGYSGNNRRGQIRVRDHAHPLVRRFIMLMNMEHATYAEVAERSGLGVDTMRYWQTRHLPRLDLFEAALNVLGYELAIRKRKGDA